MNAEQIEILEQFAQKAQRTGHALLNHGRRIRATGNQLELSLNEGPGRYLDALCDELRAAEEECAGLGQLRAEIQELRLDLGVRRV